MTCKERDWSSAGLISRVTNQRVGFRDTWHIPNIPFWSDNFQPKKYPRLSTLWICLYAKVWPLRYRIACFRLTFLLTIDLWGPLFTLPFLYVECLVACAHTSLYIPLFVTRFSRHCTKLIAHRFHWFLLSFQVFYGNQDSDTVVYNILSPPITACYVRILSVEWHNRISMRMEIYGCAGALQPFRFEPLVEGGKGGV